MTLLSADRLWSGERRRSAVYADELSLLIDSATNYAIFMLDTHGRVTVWNRGAERIKGWSEAEIVGRHVSVFYPPDEVVAGRPQADLDRAAAVGRVEENSWRMRRNGSEFLASVTLTALYDDAGALRGFGKVIRDITNEQAAAAELARREEHLRSILATVPDAMVVMDDTGRITSFSAAAERLFGCAEADVIGCHAAKLVPESARAGYIEELLVYLATGKTTGPGGVRLITAQRCGGETFPVELAFGETVSGGQRIFTGFIRDLTERQRTATRLRELQSELIHVSRLNAMGAMASTLAHELNQPLTAITSYLEATRDMLAVAGEPPLELLREALADAASQSIRAGQIVRRLRDFTARGDVEQRPEPLAAMIREAAALGLIGVSGTGIEIAMNLYEKSDIVCADRIQVQQVLINLMRNAVEAMHGCTRRQLSIATLPEAAGFMQVSVCDTGPGLAEAIRDRLFQAFATTKDDGMGLGLSICRTIVEAHGGRIWATAGRDGGTAFHFTLRKIEVGHGS